jgi:hypothetical protein
LNIPLLYLIIIVRYYVFLPKQGGFGVCYNKQTYYQGGDYLSTNFFSSLNGQFDLNSSMSSLYGDYSQIKSGAYGSLMKSYVNKVGNKSALKAYQETGSTTTAADSSTAATTASSKKSSSSKTSFLDSHLSGIKSSGYTPKSDVLKKTDGTIEAEETLASSSSTSASTTAQTTTDKYAKYKSSWLDDQLKQYDKDANKTTAADASVSVDTTI